MQKNMQRENMLKYREPYIAAVTLRKVQKRYAVQVSDPDLHRGRLHDDATRN